MSEFKLEVGKPYRTRDGKKVNIVETISSIIRYEAGYRFLAVDEYGDCFAYTEDGFYHGDKTSHRLDLVAEWEEELLPKLPKDGINDIVNHPAHYTGGEVECIDAIESAIVSLSGLEAFCTANAIKYLWRWKNKNGIEDLKKAQWYINHLIEKL